MNTVQLSSIPLNDLKRHTALLLPELRIAIEEVLTFGKYVLGDSVECFEREFAAYCGAKHAVGVANGTDALELALYAAGCNIGDDVITVANAGCYATNSILRIGANPIYAEIDPNTLLITPESFLRAITPTTKAVIVTHLFGLMASMPELCTIATNHKIIVIEDCAQAHGASIANRKAGSWGKFGCFSFYPTKNLGALGDAGCIITNDENLDRQLRGLRQYGWRDKKYHAPLDIGCNSRMDELQAAILLRLLPYLDHWNEKRRHIIDLYRLALNNSDIRFQHVEVDTSFAAHLCVIQIKNREDLIHALRLENIATDIHYPVPDYAQPAVKKYIGATPPLQHTEQVAREILSIPCFPEMTEGEVDRVIAAIQRYFGNNYAC